MAQKAQKAQQSKPFQQFRFKQDIGFSENKVNEAFSLIDRNQDGKLDVQDLKTLFKLIGEEKEDYEIYKMIHSIDNEGKTIDLSSFMQLLSYSMHDKNPERDTELAFKSFDDRKQGFIDASQIKTVMAKFNEEISLEEAEQMIKDADFDKDGKLNFSDFTKFMASVN